MAFGTASFSSLFGPLGQGLPSLQPKAIGLSTSLLTSSASAKLAKQSLATLSIADRQNFALANSRKNPAVIPPWKIDTQAQSLTQAVRDARNLTKFIDLRDPALKSVASDPDKQATFALYKALSSTKTLAEFAAQASTPSASLKRLNETFQRGLSEIRDYLTTAQLEKLDLFLGDKQYTTETSTRLGKNTATYKGGLIARSPDTVIAGLTGTETFTVSITKNGVADNFLIDLSTVVGPLTLSNIAEHVNTQIEALTILDAGGIPVPKHQSRFAITSDPVSGQYGLQINGTITEEVKLSAAAATPTLYVASTVEQTSPGFAATSRITEINGLTGVLATDDIISYAATDIEATLIKQATKAIEDKAVDPRIAALRDKMLAAAKVAIPATTTPPIDESASSLTTITSDLKVNATTTASRVVVDSEGGTYVVGNTAGSMGHQINTATGNDVYLTKFDTLGEVVFSRLLGVDGDANAFALTIDSKDNIVVAGQTDSALSTKDIISNSKDAFVVKYTKAGDEVFRYQLDTVGETAGLSLAVDVAGDIILSGSTKGAISATSGFGGGTDNLLIKLNGIDGSVIATAVSGTVASEAGKAVAIAADGNLLVASEENGSAVLRKISATDLTTEMFSVNLGALGPTGSIGDIVVDGTRIYLSGTTTNTSLNAGGTAALVGTPLGAQEGFVSAFTDGGTVVTANFTSYISTAGTDKVVDIAVSGGKLYVAGSTNGTLPGEASKGATDTFVTRLDAATGVIEDHKQFGEGLTRSTVGGVAFTTQGNSVLEKLGLPTGTVQIDQTLDVQTQTSARAGDFFYISVDGGRQKKISLADGDTYADLARKIRIAAFSKIKVEVTSTSEGNKLKISALDKGVSIDLIAGTGDQDLLRRIGIEPGKLLPKTKVFDIGSTATPDKLGGVFGLKLDGALHIRDKTTAQYALGLINDAISTVQRAFRSLEPDPLVELLKRRSSATGKVPAHILKQTANYQAGLNRLQTFSFASAPTLLFA